MKWIKSSLQVKQDLRVFFCPFHFRKTYPKIVNYGKIAVSTNAIAKSRLRIKPKTDICRYPQRLWHVIYEVITTDQADADLRGIYEYIAFELLSPDNAAGQLGRLEEHIVGFKEFPDKFRYYEKEPWHTRG